jgi:hypothetical protein
MSDNIERLPMWQKTTASRQAPRSLLGICRRETRVRRKLIGWRRRCAEVRRICFLSRTQPVFFSSQLILELSNSTRYFELLPRTEMSETMIMTYVTIAAMLGLVLSPMLIPAMVGAVHAVAGWRGAYQSLRSVAYPRLITAGRVAVPAAA